MLARLCIDSGGAPVRANQDRVLRFVFEEAPQLLCQVSPSRSVDLSIYLYLYLFLYLYLYLSIYIYPYLSIYLFSIDPSISISIYLSISISLSINECIDRAREPGQGLALRV